MRSRYLPLGVETKRSEGTVSYLPLTQREKEIFQRGMLHAASLADEYNSSSAHHYSLTDCILGKLNLLPKHRIRRNTKRLPVDFENGRWVWKGK